MIWISAKAIIDIALKILSTGATKYINLFRKSCYLTGRTMVVNRQYQLSIL